MKTVITSTEDSVGELQGFINFKRKDPVVEPVSLRLRHHGEFVSALDGNESQQQGARCMEVDDGL